MSLVFRRWSSSDFGPRKPTTSTTKMNSSFSLHDCSLGRKHAVCQVPTLTNCQSKVHVHVVSSARNHMDPAAVQLNGPTLAPSLCRLARTGSSLISTGVPCMLTVLTRIFCGHLRTHRSKSLVIHVLAEDKNKSFRYAARHRCEIKQMYRPNLSQNPHMHSNGRDKIRCLLE